jgi:hypothetical protein
LLKVSWIPANLRRSFPQEHGREQVGAGHT